MRKPRDLRKTQSENTNFAQKSIAHFRMGLLLCCTLGLIGCVSSQNKLVYFNKPNEAYYKDSVSSVAYPSVFTEVNPKVIQTEAPRTLLSLSKSDLWDMTVIEAIHIALSKSEVIRESGQFLSPQNPLLNNALGVSSIYDPAIQETGVLLGSRGVEAALSDFDAQLTSSLVWGRNEQVQNSLFTSGGLPAGSVLKDETANSTVRLQKQMATGASFALSQSMNYSGNNSPSRLFPSSYSGFMRGEFRQPLMAGYGTEFTRIAGPIGSSLSGLSGVNQGVVIARINNDITVSRLEIDLVNLMKEVEDLYWELALSYRLYDSQKMSQKFSRYFLKRIKNLAENGYEGGDSGLVAQAKSDYYSAQQRAEGALSGLYETEGRLRRLLGLPVNDGRLIRPSSEVQIAKFNPDWQTAKINALTQRPELRQSKWQIKSLELQLKAAKNLTKPRFDLVTSYQVNAFGDDLLSGTDDDGVTPQGFDSAYESLTAGQQTGWNAGVEFSMPFGQRAAHAQQKQLEFQIAKMRKVLADQELEITHELSNAITRLDGNYKQSVTNNKRRKSAIEFLQAQELQFDLELTSFDQLLRARLGLVEAEVAFYQSVIEYNKAITEVHFRQGVLLQENNITMLEGDWKKEAYLDAERRAIARAHAFDDSDQLLHSDPIEFVAPEPAAFEPHTPIKRTRLKPASPKKAPKPVPDKNHPTVQQSAPAFARKTRGQHGAPKLIRKGTAQGLQVASSQNTPDSWNPASAPRQLQVRPAISSPSKVQQVSGWKSHK